jgi:hypothetical protein
MSDSIAPSLSDESQGLMDELLRAGIPEIKLALGEIIDRENARPLPAKYARLLPESVLLVTLRPDAAEALRPIAADLERELTNSCNRHGSLYDRGYRVRLQRSEDRSAPLFAVASRAGVGESEPSESAEAPPPVAPPSSRQASIVREETGPLPITDVDTTPLFAANYSRGWEGGRWVLVVEDEGGREREVFRLGEPVVTIGRDSDDPGLRPTIAISNAPHVSRRQLALAWQEREGAAGFKVYNLGLNQIHVGEKDIPGARLKRDAKLEAVPGTSTGWLTPGTPLRVGDHGPILRIEEVPPDPDDIRVDPDATVFE